MTDPDPYMDPDPDPHRDSKTCLDGGMQCPSACSFEN